jgi:hypothetical protein
MARSRTRQTMAKMTRERAVKEKRARKQEKKDEKKQAAAEARENAAGGAVSPHLADDEAAPEPLAHPPEPAEAPERRNYE